MVSPVLAQAILGQRAPDIVGQFEAGQEKSRQLQARELAGRALSEGGGEALTELQKVAPQIAIQISNQIGARSSQQLDDFVKSAGITRRLLESGDEAGALQFANQRMQIAQQQGMNATPIQTIRDMIAQGKTDQALNQLRAFDDSISQATAAEREFASLTAGLSEEESEKARRIKLGLEARATPITPEREREITRSKELAKQSVALSGEAFKQLPSIRKNIFNIDKVISAIDKGAETGVIANLLPSVRAASIELDNLRNQMGLDVIGGTTFGALSESELQFALATALPTTLEGPELKKWLQDKKEAQKKVAKALTKHARFFGKGGTIAELLDRQEKEQQKTGIAPAPVATQPPAPVGGAGQIKILGVR